MRKIFVTNRIGIENTNFQNDKNFYIISITEPYFREATLQNISDENVLRLSFHDVWPMNIPEEKIKKIYGDIILFELHHAVQILAFVKKIPENSTLFVHCEQGYSRSPAIASALCELWSNCDERDFFDEREYRPNMLVYSRLLNMIEAHKGNTTINDFLLDNLGLFLDAFMSAESGDGDACIITSFNLKEVAEKIISSFTRRRPKHNFKISDKYSDERSVLITDFSNANLTITNDWGIYNNQPEWTFLKLELFQPDENGISCWESKDENNPS